MRFTFTISHTPGKDLTIADTLSRAPTHSASIADEQFCQETEMFVNAITTNLPATEQFLTKIAKKQDEDEICSQVKQFSLNGWPQKQTVSDLLKDYYSVSDKLSVYVQWNFDAWSSYYHSTFSETRRVRKTAQWQSRHHKMSFKSDTVICQD